MTTPVRITFRHIPQSEAFGEKIHEKIDKLASLYPEILDCDATVDQIDRHQQQGRHFRVTIGVRIPGEELIANTNHEDAFIALRNAMAAVRRQLSRAIGIRRLNSRSPAAAPGSRATRKSDIGTEEEEPDAAVNAVDKSALEALPLMEEEDAVALLSGASRHVNPERVAENVEQY